MSTNDIARIGTLVGEPARAAMLLALMDGRALTARELAQSAGITAATASRHLGLLVDAQLLRVEPQGRHRYHRLASPAIASLLEGLLQLAASTRPPLARPVTTGPRDAALRTARTCYDHLAGRLGVAIADRLLDDGAIEFDEPAGRVTPHADAALRRLGLPAAPAGAACRPCLDWSERRPHVAGRIGTLICRHCLEAGWLQRRPGTRALDITPTGAQALRDWLGLEGWHKVVGGS